jgi:hydrogenase expression/formation protein HypC
MALFGTSSPTQGMRMCVGLPGQVLEVDGAGSARVDVQGTVRTVSLALLGEPPVPGDWVLVQLGFAMSRVTPAEAADTIRLLRLLEASIEDEIGVT